jgi:hypothetical protein
MTPGPEVCRASSQFLWWRNFIGTTRFVCDNKTHQKLPTWVVNFWRHDNRYSNTWQNDTEHDKYDIWRLGT